MFNRIIPNLTEEVQGQVWGETATHPRPGEKPSSEFLGTGPF